MCNKNDTYCLSGHHTIEQWAWIAADSILFVMILCGNLFTVYILRSSRLISNRFVLSLACTDMLVGLTLPYHMAFTIFPQLSVTKTTCILKFVFVLMACCCSILNVTAIAFDRYLAIIHPFKYETLMTRRVVRRVLFVAGVFALGISTIPIYWNTWEEATVCELGQVLPTYYMIAILLPAFLVIWAVMIAIYARIWHEAVMQAEKLRKTNVSQQCRPSFQVVLLVMGCFTICWLPFLIVTCAQAVGYRDKISSTVYKALLCLALSSSALNPIIYAWKNAEFKEAVQAVLRCKVKQNTSTVVTASGTKGSAHPQTSV
ncbi:adenosine receptor A2b [Halyomorpha halys]|uniref:adenosine receptor A2b n=1 Tax=Halyomorpha halys TaxID=286706 RepID=UPI0006D518E0|nr:adenosine receptor A2b [Halyomorpha halys]XP_014276211.1 adenosine receptor A2b [Halyomorpha halys]XP_014276212.1 adenosine receptor A2b [Halyomorpha halys]XP_014276213.1 adenosine receptor A2b [Halyomorpha halys]XP_014276214.1 adenosine receptor A2b [Halyomorpha halys]XP_014276215.1 adenosine receptor A2b [Halyomorpha halys]XP_014276217.1 adenosine receptor A2b [Halyomorpha halys]XP_014276218.1 adenosine receptor A2b [Halyomorpha halys]